MWRIFEGLTPAFTRFAYTPPGYAAAGSPASRQRIAEDRRADTIQKTADRHPGNAPIQAINIPIQTEAEAVRQAEEGSRRKADSGCNTADRQTQKNSRGGSFFIPTGCLYSLIASNTRKAGKSYQGREGNRQQTEAGQIADAAGIVQHPGRHKNALRDRFCFALSVCKARLCFGLSV